MERFSDKLLINFRENYYSRWGEYMYFDDTSLDITNVYYNEDDEITSIEVFLESLLSVLHIDDLRYGYRQCTGKTLGCYLITNVSEPYLSASSIPQVTLNVFSTKKGCFIYG